MGEFASECQFCREFTLRECPTVTPPGTRFLYEGDQFLVFPTLGCFVEGYLLICPRMHVPSCAALERPLLGKLEKLTASVTRVVRDNYGSCVVFEHGLASCRRRAGGCIDHAHLHVVPGDFDLVSVLSERFVPQVLQHWSELEGWNGRPYLLIQSAQGELYICDVPDVLPSQFLRQHAADKLNVLARWDWRNHLCMEEIDNTIKRLKGVFAKELD